jgi:hypothetical protein
LVQLLLFDQKIDKAVRKIQAFIKSKNTKRNFLAWMNRRIKAKELIVRVWKKKKWQRLCRQLARQRKNEAAIQIQKYLNGFLARQKVLPNILLQRFNSNMDFFDKKRQEILTDFQIRLRRVWFKYRTAKKEREAYERNLREQIDELERARQEISNQLEGLNESCPNIIDPNKSLLSSSKKKTSRQSVANNQTFSLNSAKKNLLTSHTDFKRVV